MSTETTTTRTDTTMSPTKIIREVLMEAMDYVDCCADEDAQHDEQAETLQDCGCDACALGIRLAEAFRALQTIERQQNEQH